MSFVYDDSYWGPEAIKERDEKRREKERNTRFTLYLFEPNKEGMDIDVPNVPLYFGMNYLNGFNREFSLTRHLYQDKLGRVRSCDSYIMEYLRKIGASYGQVKIDNNTYKSGYIFYKEDYFNEKKMNDYIRECIVRYRKEYAENNLNNYTSNQKTYNKLVAKLETYTFDIAKKTMMLFPEYSDSVVLKSREQEQKERKMSIEEWNKKPYIEKKAIQFANRKTAPTLSTGWVTYIIFMLLGFILRECVAWWIGVTIIFLIWRKSEIDKYN